MPPTAGRGKGKSLARKYSTKKRKAEETEDLKDQANSTKSPTRERRVGKSKKDVGPSTILERPPDGSRSPQQFESSPQLLPLHIVTYSPNSQMLKVNIYKLYFV
jgi:hypothetical protein